MFPGEGSDVLHEVLKHIPEKRRRVIALRHHLEAEHLIGKEIISKSITDKEL